jgi:hypothetical protein
MTYLTTPSELMALLDIQFNEVEPIRVNGWVAADEPTTSHGDSCTAGYTRRRSRRSRRLAPTRRSRTTASRP